MAYKDWKSFTNLENERSLSIVGKITVFKTPAILKIYSTSCISKNNSKFNYTRIKQNSKRIYMENSQS